MDSLLWLLVFAYGLIVVLTFFIVRLSDKVAQLELLLNAHHAQLGTLADFAKTTGDALLKVMKERN